MEICVLNGSPKGKTSVTVQYIHYLIQRFPNQTFNIINISSTLVRLEKNKEYFSKILSDIAEAKMIIWATPVHLLFVPGYYKRFIELIFERNSEGVFRGKQAVSLSTSIHFHDHLVHNYLHGISEDLGMDYLGFHSADMDDLMNSRQRRILFQFMQEVIYRINDRLPAPKSYPRVAANNFIYSPEFIDRKKLDAGNKRIVLLADQKDDGNLRRMTEQIASYFYGHIEIIHIRDIHIKGGCLGCCNCAYDNKCIYKDDFVRFYNEVICCADILLYAGTIKDRYLSAMWKIFFDRSFFIGHTPALSGKQLGWILSGPLAQLPNLKEKLTGYAEIQHVNLVDIITDEVETSSDLDQMLYSLALRLVRASNHSYSNSRTFRGVGGGKIFRDEFWGRFRFPFYADYRAYKKLGLYDFPQKNIKQRLINSFVLLLCKIPAIQRSIFSKSRQYMVKPLLKTLKNHKNISAGSHSQSEQRLEDVGRP